MQLSQLEHRMQAYYTAVPDFPAFRTPSDHPLEWRHALAEVSRLVGSSQEPKDSLDFRSGTGTHDFLAGCQKVGNRLHWRSKPKISLASFPTALRRASCLHDGHLKNVDSETCHSMYDTIECF